MLSKITLAKRTLSVIIPILLCACANPVKKSMAEVDEHTVEAMSMVHTMQSGTSTVRDTVMVHDDQWVDPTPIAMDESKSAPQLECIENFHPRRLLDADEFAQIVGKDCNIVVHITADARRRLSGMGDPSGTGAGAGAGPIAPTAFGPGGAILPGIPSAGINSQQTGSMGNARHQVDVNYNGPLSGLLDEATAQLGLNWKVNNGVVDIFYTESKTFRIDMIPTATSMSSSVMSGTSAQAGISSAGGAGGGSGSSSGGVTGTSGTTQQTDVTLTNDPRKDFELTLKSMVSSLGQIGPLTSTGTITVTDTPDVLNAIQSFVDSQNVILTKQVLLNVRVLSVTLNNNDQYGINWGLVFKDVSGKYGFNLANTFSTLPNAVSGTINILNTATGHTAQFAGSSAIISALADQGKVSVVTSPSATTLNMQPVIVQVATQTGYLASTSTSQVAQVGSSTALQAGMITSGFNMNLLPYVLGDGKTLLLQYNMNLSSAPTLRTVTSNGSSIEIPTMDTKILSHKVRLESGQTLVLSGFEQSNNNGDSQGVGSSSFWFLGGGLTRTDSKVVLVVMITPIVSN